MSNKALLIYQWVVTLGAAISGVVTVVGLLTHSPWIHITGGVFITFWATILFTAIPMILLNDAYNRSNAPVTDNH